MKRLNIVLVEPQIPQNTGNISRTCAVTGAALHLVKPYGFEISDKHLKRAGLDYWDKLEVYEYENLDEFFKRTSGEYFFFTTKGKNVYTEFQYPDNAYMRKDLRSLNLSNSVAVAVYEILRQWDFPDLTREGNLTEYEW